jgi:hypothetical protein
MSESGSEEDGKSAFRVVDRRRFDADGSERSEDEIDSPVQAKPATATADPESKAAEPAPDRVSEQTTPESAAHEERIGSAPADPAGSGTSQPTGTPGGGEAAPGEPPPPTFSSLILSLSTQALFSLGEIAESPDAEPQIDLLAGKQLIDLLGVLQEKTSGNLDAGESELMERILYDLRLRFVEIARRSPARPPEN